MITVQTSLPQHLARWSESFTERIERLIPSTRDAPSDLISAMRYSMLAPGKRLRPYLVARAFELSGGSHSSIEVVCVAVECVHVFTLIHDDLPAMDDAGLRRGQPTNHRVYGEAMAVLAGDALLPLGVELLTRFNGRSQTICRLVRELVEAIGYQGVIGGQASDMTPHSDPDESLLRSIHERKTARLFQACCRLGSIAAEGDERSFKNLSDFGLYLGLAFQISDDLLDVLANSEETGKDTGGDADDRKQTCTKLLGVSGSRRVCEQYVRKAVSMLAPFGSGADDLRQIAEYVRDRSR